MKIPSGAADKASHEEANPLLAALQSRHEKPKSQAKESQSKGGLEALAAQMREESKRKCPGCEALVADDAAICVKCGYSFKSGKVEQTRILKAEVIGAGGQVQSSGGSRRTEVTGEDATMSIGHVLAAGFTGDIVGYGIASTLGMIGLQILFSLLLGGIGVVGGMMAGAGAGTVVLLGIVVISILCALFMMGWACSRLLNVADAYYRNSYIAGTWRAFPALGHALVPIIIAVGPMAGIAAMAVMQSAANGEPVAMFGLLLLPAAIWAAVTALPSLAVVGAEHTLNPARILSFLLPNLHWIVLIVFIVGAVVLAIAVPAVIVAVAVITGTQGDQMVAFIISACLGVGIGGLQFYGSMAQIAMTARLLRRHRGRETVSAV